MGKLLVVITAIGLFSSLAAFSYGKYGPAWDGQGYPVASVERLNRMSADAGAAFKLPPSPSKQVYRWANKRAALIADAYSLKPEDLDKTVDIRRLP